MSQIPRDSCDWCQGNDDLRGVPDAAGYVPGYVHCLCAACRQKLREFLSAPLTRGDALDSPEAREEDCAHRRGDNECLIKGGPCPIARPELRRQCAALALTTEREWLEGREALTGVERICALESERDELREEAETAEALVAELRSELATAIALNAKWMDEATTAKIAREAAETELRNVIAVNREKVRTIGESHAECVKGLTERAAQAEARAREVRGE